MAKATSALQKNTALRGKQSETSSKEKVGNGWRNRITGSGTLSAEVILANVDNWRVHPKAQREAMKTAFDTLGWIQQVIVNEATGRLIDGHMRVELAKERGESVPVIYVHLTPEEEKLALSSIDPIGDMASTDKVALSKLIQDSKQFGDDVDALMKSIGDQNRLKPEEIIDTEDLPDFIPQAETSAFDLNAMAMFSSSNKYGLPDLLPELLCDQIPHKVWAGYEFGEPEDKEDYLFMKDRVPSQWSPEGAILGFYVFDTHFDYIWDDAVKNVRQLLSAGWGGVIAPDFSFSHAEPFAKKLWQLYRERWIGRFWQECGIPVIPNTCLMMKQDHDWILHTLPKDCPVLAMQVRTVSGDELGKKAVIYGLNEHIDHCKPKAYIIYGGEEHQQWLKPNLPNGVEYVYLPSVSKMRSEMRKGTKKRNSK